MSDEEAAPSFDDAAQEATYWKIKTRELKSMLQEAENGLREFAESSKELEQEMERELTQSAKDLEDARTRNEKLGQDKEEWKAKYQSSLLEHNKTLAEMSRELSQFRDSHNIYKAKLRDMELDNDELENAERMVRSSLNDVEQRYNQQMERATLMEEELIAKNQLEEENQRLRDEIRDLNEEVAVLRERDAPTSPAPSRLATPAEAISNYDHQEGELSLTELTGRPTWRTSSSPTRSDSVTSVHRASPAKPRSSFLPSATLVPPMVSRKSLAKHAHRGSKDLSKTITRDERASPGTIGQRSSATSRIRADGTSSRAAGATGAAKTPRTAVRGAAGATSRKMMRDLLGNMSALQDRLHKATSFGPSTSTQLDTEKSALPRPSSRMSASVVGTPVNRPRPSFDGKSSIPIASGGLNRSIRRTSSRASIGPPRANLMPTTDADSPSDATHTQHYLPGRSVTPTMYTARARAHPNVSTATGLSRGPVTGESAEATSPLDFLNTEPDARPHSRTTFAARDSLAKSRKSSISYRLGHSHNHSTSVDFLDNGDAPSSSSSSSAASGLGASIAGRPRGSTVTALMPSRKLAAANSSPSSTASSSTSSVPPPDARPSSSSSSSIAAFRESRLNQQSQPARPSSSFNRPSHRPLSGLSAAGGPPPPSWKKRHDPLLQAVAAGAFLRRSRSTSVGSEH